MPVFSMKMPDSGSEITGQTPLLFGRGDCVPWEISPIPLATRSHHKVSGGRDHGAGGTFGTVFCWHAYDEG